MAANYRLVFDVATQPAPDIWPLVLISAIGFALALAPRRLLDRVNTRGLPAPLDRAFLIVWFVVVTSVIAISTFDDFRQLKHFRSISATGQLPIAEGCLSGFHPMPASGHDDERIAVDGKHFTYSDYDSSAPTFNQTESHGGPIHADTAVKIQYDGNHILKLYVADHACPKAADIPR